MSYLAPSTHKTGSKLRCKRILRVKMQRNLTKMRIYRDRKKNKMLTSGVEFFLIIHKRKRTHVPIDQEMGIWMRWTSMGYKKIDDCLKLSTIEIIRRNALVWATDQVGLIWIFKDKKVTSSIWKQVQSTTRPRSTTAARDPNKSKNFKKI